MVFSSTSLFRSVGFLYPPVLGIAALVEVVVGLHDARSGDGEVFVVLVERLTGATLTVLAT